MIWPRKNFDGQPFMCSGQCTIPDLSGSVRNDNAKSGWFQR